jgi:hypothetical protein
MFIKLGENTQILGIENTESCIPEISQDILDNFKKTASTLKKIAPKAEDFLYFSAVMMHAAEASALNEDGTNKLNVKGKKVQVGWDKAGGTWRWTTNDPSIKPYKNSNGDIFPEEELVKAYKKWVHKPLCIDHKSSSVDHVRGFIVDTYYDRNLKRVIALCALDKHNYPDLARKVATGYSNCVSMGTAVGRAICSDCARVAKAEPDFCDHMRKKTCYGEINVDLNPIELSIVVNGADPKAHIKHIIAAANTLNTYVENKSKELAKIAETKYTANISIVNESAEPTNANFSVETSDLDDLKSEIERIYDQVKSFSEIAEKSEKDATELALEEEPVSLDRESEEQVGEDGSDNLSSLDHLGYAPPHQRFASSSNELNSLIKELREVTATIDTKLTMMKNNLNKLSSNSINIQEENMSGSKEINKQGYYQGGGGVNEPTPGQPKYQKDPTNERLRLESDKQMVGQSPFPEVGGVEDLHPGVESAGVSELERKKMLARAEAEERALRRNAIVNLAKQALQDKKAYFQGGGGVNEPTPGKVKYQPDSLQSDVREEGDKQMVGQKPFPGVGSADGLHPSPASAEVSDELKRKQMLSRAGLRARFIKAANVDGTQDLGKSAWEVFSGDKLLLTASVEDLTGGNSTMLYDSIATKEFGSKLIEKVKAFGAEGIRSLVKKAQPAPAPEAAPAAAPAPEAAAPAPEAAAPAPEAAAEGQDKGKEGDPKAMALDLAEKMRDLASDLVEAVRALTGEQAEMGVMEGGAPEMGASASFTLNTLNTLRKELNGALVHAMKEAVAELRDHTQELDMISDMYDSGNVNASNAEFVGSIVQDALDEAKTATADSLKLMTAFVKYARGTKEIVKRAELEQELSLESRAYDLHSDPEEVSFDDIDGDLFDLAADDELNLDSSSDSSDASDHAYDLEMSSDDNHAKVEVPDELLKQLPPGSKMAADLSTKAGRAALRAKLAADATGKMDDGEEHDMSKPDFSDMLEQAHKLVTDLGLDASDDLAEVDTVESRNKAMMDVATSPVKVRKEAEAIHKLVSEGKLDTNDLDALVAEGLDKDAVAYYKKYYNQVDGGSEFASALVKEHVKASLETELGTYKVKMARAYELAYDMVDRGLCLNDKHAVAAQVDEIMKFNNESFESLKRVVAKHNPTLRKEAGRMPQVGMIGSGEVNSTLVSDDWTQLSAAFAKSGKRMF